jgi:hypothetical protein
MSNNRDTQWDDEDEDDTVDSFQQYEQETDLVKKLRRDNKVLQKRNKELESSYSELSKAQRERIINDALASKGVNSKIAKFIPSDIEASQDAINSWLESNADIFGIAKAESKSAATQQDIQSMNKIENVTSNLDAPSASGDFERLLSEANSEADVLKLLRGNL